MAIPGGAMSQPMSKVELTVSCKNLKDKDLTSKSDPMCVLFVKDFGSNTFREDQRTERVVNSLNPEFSKQFPLNYFFEESQKLRFELYDIDSDSSKLDSHDFLGRLDCTLGEIVGAPGSKIHKSLIDSHGKASGSIVVAATEVGESKEVCVMQWQGHKLDKKDTFGKSDPFLLFYRINQDNSNSLVFRSDVVKNSLNPVWKPFKIPMRHLTGGNSDGHIFIQCFDYDSDGGQASHDLIGEIKTTFKQLTQGAQLELINPKKHAKKKGYKNSGVIQLMRSSVHIEHSFLDYIRGGTQIHFTVAVDFTASNGNPVQPNSLHYIHPHQPNQYMLALKAVGEICQDYDTDKMFPALGFGGKLPNGQVSHDFFMNFHPSDPHCHGVDGVLNAYRNAILQVQLYGPTNFSPVINHVSKFATASSNQGGAHYFVLLILTDGIITDFEQTKAAIVNASSLPMSIIIVGVGNDEFESMDDLDADKQRLSFNGCTAERDIVQFVPFRDYLNPGNFEMSQAKLAKDVLKEIPNQLTSWMIQRGIQAKPPPKVNVDQVQNSLNQMGLGGGGAPPASGFPQQTPFQGQFPPAQPPQGYPQQQISGQPGYPPSVPGGYPAPPPAGGYPGQQPVYPSQTGGYPSYPGQQAIPGSGEPRPQYPPQGQASQQPYNPSWK